MAGNDSYTQQRLASDTLFQGRVRAAIANVAWQVLEEDPATANHAAREAFARSVISNLTMAAQTAASWIVERPNLLAFATTYDFPSGSIVTAAGDADIQSQLVTDWDILAGGPTVAPSLWPPMLPPPGGVTPPSPAPVAPAGVTPPSTKGKKA
jgi:hypothetical protein